MRQTEIRIENARTHNLKGVDCRIPLSALTVVTGPSGSGKSSLAFDTLYAEGQRRYVTSLSSYARQFLERLPRPPVDAISSLPPAIAIEQRNRVANARSTVGTATEILDGLRLLYAKIGQTRCPDCGKLVLRGSVTGVVDRIAERFAGARVLVGTVPAPRPGESLEELRRRSITEGYGRLFTREGAVVDWSEADRPVEAFLEEAPWLLIDRLVLPGPDAAPDADLRVRLSEAVSRAFERGRGELEVVSLDGDAASHRAGLVCDDCGRRFSEPDPARLSFNSVLGACEVCQGFGRTAEIDWQRVIPDPSRSLEQDAIAPFATPTGRAMQRDLLRACRQQRVAIDVPWSDLDDAARDFVLAGDGGDWYGVQGYFDWLDGRRYKVQARVQIARYRCFEPCLACEGTRLGPDARSIEIAGRDIGSLCRENVAGLKAWLDAADFAGGGSERAGRVLEMLCTRVATVAGVGLGYLPLDRPMRTLSGGEAQRIQLATALGGGLTASLYVLDEPSIGLHPRDLERLLEVILAIRDRGNTVVVVEHALEVLRAADHVIDLGPGAGQRGGQIVVQGGVDAVRACEASATGKLLRGEIRRRVGARRGRAGSVLGIRGARCHNLQGIDVDVPLERFVVVTGVSGAGKSTLVHSVLASRLGGTTDRTVEAGECDAIEGAERIREVVIVDATPAVRSPRSNPATVSKAFDRIRTRFAATREARALGVGPGWFSFNVAGGRCDACEGAGEVVIDMQFLDDVRVPCDACDGRRYRREVLGVKLDGRSIVDVLGLTIDEAAEIFSDDGRLVSRLEPFRRVGLGYLTLGQPLSTLSGGEHQRVRLALGLAEPAPGRLYLLDEPTTGLHAADVDVLLGCLDEIVAGGGSVVVIEHDVEVMLRADWVIDLGPEGGPGGGRLVAAGTPEEVAAVAGSHTGRAIAAALAGS